MIVVLVDEWCVCVVGVMMLFICVNIVNIVLFYKKIVLCIFVVFKRCEVVDCYEC